MAKHTLPDLPYPKNALEPLMSAETLEYHHGKHHAAYVKKLNELIAGTEYESLPLEEIVRRASGPIFNNAAQHWNHSFFWQCLAPGGDQVSGELKSAIERDFGGMDRFLAEFSKEGAEHFGSGWVWLMSDGPGGKLSVEAFHDAKNPLTAGKTPLLTCDLWEHAYYIDYRNERPKFIEAFSKLASWSFAARAYSAVTQADRPALRAS